MNEIILIKEKSSKNVQSQMRPVAKPKETGGCSSPLNHKQIQNKAKFLPEERSKKHKN